MMMMRMMIMMMTYFCFINNRLDSSPVELIVQDAPEPPPHRPMISSISSR